MASRNPREERLASYMKGQSGFAATLVASGMNREKSAAKIGQIIRKIDLVAENRIDELQTMRRRFEDEGRLPKIACGAGCWYCCTQEVGATMPELVALADHIREYFNEAQIETLRQNLKAYRNELEEVGRDAFNLLRRKCPLLANDLCSVFVARPLMCRGYNSLDVEACKRSTFEGVERTVPRFEEQLELARSLSRGIRRGLAESNMEAGTFSMAVGLDILLGEPNAGERCVAGEPLLEPARLT